MAWSVSDHRAHLSHQPSRQMYYAPGTVHNDRLPGFFPSYPTPAVPSGPPHHHPYPYAMVSPASFTPDTPDFDQSPSSCYRHESPPPFRPLSMSVLNDPAFSPDPRVHPHFSLTNASFYKELPSKSPVIIVTDLSHTPPATPSDLSSHHSGFISHSPESEEYHPSSTSSSTTSSTCVSLDSGTHTTIPASTSPTTPSVTSHSHSPAHSKTPRVSSPGSPLELSFPFITSAVSASPCHDPRSSLAMLHPTSDRPIPKRNTSAPEQRVKAVVKPPTVRFQTTPVHADGSNRPEGKRRMKDFMRRLTGSRALDRIDEIDEANPLGARRHYDDPFEAVGSNLARLGPAHMYNDVDILRGDFYSKNKRKNVPSSTRNQKSARMSGANGPSQNLVPGQILRHSPSDLISPTPHITQPNTVHDLFSHKPGSGQTRPSQSHSPPYYSIDPPEGAPFSHTSPHGPAGRSSPPARIHPFGDDIPHIPHYPEPAHDELPPHQMESAPVLPPGYNEQYPKTLLSPRADANQGTLSSFPIVEPLVGQEIHLAPHFPRHHSTSSLDRSHTHTTRSSHSTSRTKNNLQPPRNHHLPKRLVMPAPLQPQQQQQQPPLYPRAHSYDHYADADAFPAPDCHTHDPPAMYNQGRNLLRKKTAVFPGNVPLPTHAPVAHADAISPLTKHPTNLFSDAEKVKEGVRRRRLSKRKHDG